MTTQTLPESIVNNLDAMQLPQDNPYRQAIEHTLAIMQDNLHTLLHEKACLTLANNTMQESLEMIELIVQCDYPDALASIAHICQTLRQPS